MDNIGSVGINSGLRFADWFFDGILVDSIVLSEISDSRKKLQDLRSQVQNILSDLNRYICSRCGYSEEWIRTEDIDKVRSSKHQLPHKVG